MDGQRFDDLTRSLAHGTSRRGLLKGFGGALGGATVLLGRQRLADARPACREAGHPCEGNQHCCEGLVCQASGPGAALRCTACPDGTTACNGECLTLPLQSNENCGSCGNACPAGEACETCGDRAGCGRACPESLQCRACGNSLGCGSACPASLQCEFCGNSAGCGSACPDGVSCVTCGYTSGCGYAPSTCPDGTCPDGFACFNGGCFRLAPDSNCSGFCGGVSCGVIYGAPDSVAYLKPVCGDMSTSVGACASDDDCPAGSFCSSLYNCLGGNCAKPYLCTKPCTFPNR